MLRGKFSPSVPTDHQNMHTTGPHTPSSPEGGCLTELLWSCGRYCGQGGYVWGAGCCAIATAATDVYSRFPVLLMIFHTLHYLQMVIIAHEMKHYPTVNPDRRGTCLVHLTKRHLSDLLCSGCSTYVSAIVFHPKCSSAEFRPVHVLPITTHGRKASTTSLACR